MQDNKDNYDLRLANVPKIWKKVRKGRRMKMEFVPRVPTILRDLAPSTGFNPQVVWENEKRMDAINLQSSAVQSDNLDVILCRSLGGGTTHKDLEKESRTVQIQEKQNIIRADKAFQDDMKRISNTESHKADGDYFHIQNQIETECGSLVLLIKILKSSLERRQLIEVMDVLWAIQEHAHYQRGKRELGECLRKVSSPLKADFSSLSHCARLILDHREVLIRAKKLRDREDMIIKQLTDMSDRLPPLSRYTCGFKLDDWQKQVLRWIDAGKSVIISAPTSSGKTILATYVASLGSRQATLKAHAASQKQKRRKRRRRHPNDPVEVVKREDAHLTSSTFGDSEPYAVLFVVPTEPLVWQVGAQFYKHMTTNIALVSNQLTYSSHTNINFPPSVVVGTPLALETALMKARGRVTHLEKENKIDMEQLPGGFHHYKWAVYDEIHSLDGEEGDALQRLIRMLDCKFLALSATIGNATELRTWMEGVKGDQFVEEDVETMTLQSEDEEEEDDEFDKMEEENKGEEESVGEEEDESEVNLIVHESRFIDLQRHVWTQGDFETKDEETDGGGLSTLHPLSAVSLETLNRGFSSTVSLPFTARDNYDLWVALQDVFGDMTPSPVEEIDPNNFFGAEDRLTLTDIHRYEVAQKVKLEELSHEYPERIQTILERFRVPELPLEYDICDLVLDLKDKGMLPCVVFHLNTFEALGLFRKIVGGLEMRQNEEFPDYENELIEKQNTLDAEYDDKLKQDKRLQLQLASGNKEDRGDVVSALLSSRTDRVREVVDTSAPHPKFVLNPPGLPKREYDDMCKDVKREDKFKGVISRHSLMRALRRGVGIVMNDSVLQEYRRCVMRLAMQNKLAVVISDESLAYGVNMPFRSVVFPSGMEGELNPLMLQQMAGRAGRRGLDTQGHYVYAGMTAEKVKELMLSPIPAIEGKIQLIMQQLPLFLCYPSRCTPTHS